MAPPLSESAFVGLSTSVFSSNPLAELALALGLAALAGSVFSWARQTPVPAYLLAGAVAGPVGLSLFGEFSDAMAVLAEIGVIVMLFLVGVRLDLKVLGRVGRRALVAAGAEIAIVGALGFGLSQLLGIGLIDSVYVAIAAAISSTVLVVTILGQRKELDSLHGKLSVSILLLQDILAVFALFVLPALGGPEARSNALGSISNALVRLAAFLGIAGLAYLVFGPLSAVASKSLETSYLFLVSWMLAIAVAGTALGLGAEAGAFTAGVMVSTAKHGHLAASRLAGVRDFLIPIFFFSIGAQVSFSDLGRALPLAAGLLVVVLLAKPIATFAALAGARYGARSASLTALSMAQTSEFSLLLVAGGVSAGQITPEVQNAVVFTVFGSFVISSLLASHAPSIYVRLEGVLSRLGTKGSQFDPAVEVEEGGKFPSAPVVIFGVGRIGGVLVDQLRALGVSYIAFDFDPAIVTNMRKADSRIYFGDAEDPDLFDYIDLKAAKVVVSTARNEAMSRQLIDALRSKGYEGTVVVTAEDDEESWVHVERGADLVLVPYRDAAELATAAVCEALSVRPPSVLSEGQAGEHEGTDVRLADCEDAPSS